MPTWLVTGGAGFIGGNFVLRAVESGIKVVNLDALTYAGNLDTLVSIQDNPLHVFSQGDIGDGGLVARLLAEHQPDAVVNFAAESHVDTLLLLSNQLDCGFQRYETHQNGSSHHKPRRTEILSLKST